MKSNRAIPALLCATLAASSGNFARADFTYTETTQVTGGSLVAMMKMVGTFSKTARQFGQPVESTIIVKGNRMSRINPDRTEIIDLDKGAVTNIDNMKHLYTVMTFAQMKQQMEEAVARARAEQARQPASQPTQVPPGTEVKFKVKVRNTEATKEVAGLNARESIMVMAMEASGTSASQTLGQASAQTGTLGFTSDIWLVPEIPGYKEVRDFYIRMAEKLGAMYGTGPGNLTSLIAQMPPGAMEGMADMGREMSKIKGVPVLTVMRMGTTANGAPLPAASEVALAPDNTPSLPSAGDMVKQGATSVIANSLHLGGFGFGRKKAAEPPAPVPDASAPAGSVVMIETTTQLSSFSSLPVSPSRFDIPAGYKQVEGKELR